MDGDAARAPRTDLEAVREEIVALVGRHSGRLRSHGVGEERVAVGLRSDQEVLALELLARFGGAIHIRLGRHDFPLDREPIAPPAVPVPTLDLPGLRLAVELQRETWRPDEIIRGVIRLTHVGTGDPVRFSTGSTARGMLLDLDGIPVADCSLPNRGTGRRIDLAPGATTTLAVVSGSDTFDPSRGAVLAPGTYGLLVRVLADVDGRRGSLVAPPTPVRIE